MLGELKKSLRGAKAIRLEQRGNLQLAVDREVEIAAVVRLWRALSR